jgi:ribonuclease T1
VKWNRQTVIWVASGLATVAFVSLMLALGEREYSFTLGGDEPSSSGPAAPGPGQDPEEPETGDTDPESGLPWVHEDDLPVFAQGTLALIDQGGPFPCAKDGATFQNREGILPDQDSGYYAEYTVLSTASCEGPRGTTRIVTGDGGEYYWTEDHYESFDRILRRQS